MSEAIHIDFTKRLDKPKCQEAEASLPEELRPIFRELVLDYLIEAFRATGSGYVSYRVLAELVRAGWRRPS